VNVAGHSGGSPWSAGGVDPSGAAAVTNWINNGRPAAPVEVPLLSRAAFELLRRPVSSHAPGNLRSRRD